MGISIGDRLVFKRWSSFFFSLLGGIFFSALVVGMGAAAAVGPYFDLPVIPFGATVSLVPAILIWFTFNLGFFPGVEVYEEKVIVKKFLGEVEVPSGVISEVKWKGGLSFILKNGKEIPCPSFPDSLYSMAFRYRNFKKVALGISAAMATMKQVDGTVVERDYWRIRTFLLIVAFYFSVFIVAYLAVRP